MNSKQVERRQSKLLQQLAMKVEYRSDKTIPIEEGLLAGITATQHGTRLVFEDKDNDSSSSSTSSYDWNHLLDEGLIEMPIPPRDQRTKMEREGKRPVGNVQITKIGLKLIREFERSWWSKMYEKQPATSVSAIVAIANTVWTICLAVWAWYVVAPSQ